MKPVPHDPALEASERHRREELARSQPYQAGVAAALAQALSNQKELVQTRFGDVRRTQIKRDLNKQSRASYERTYGNMLREVERLAGMTGKPVSGVPAYYPPVDDTEHTVTVNPPAVDLGKYTDTKGMGPSGKGLPVNGPGSNTDPDWVNG